MSAYQIAEITWCDHERVEQTPVGVARSANERALGMTGRGWDHFAALVFVQPATCREGFHGRGLLAPVALAFFDEDGVLVDRTVLPRGGGYRPPQPYRYAVESPIGGVATHATSIDPRGL